MPVACFILLTANAFFFQSSGRGISMHIFILTGIPKGHISGYKNGHILQKMYF